MTKFPEAGQKLIQMLNSHVGDFLSPKLFRTIIFYILYTDIIKRVKANCSCLRVKNKGVSLVCQFRKSEQGKNKIASNTSVNERDKEPRKERREREREKKVRELKSRRKI